MHRMANRNGRMTKLQESWFRRIRALPWAEIVVSLFALAAAVPAQGQATSAATGSPGTRLAEWGGGLPVADGVGEQMARFESDRESVQAEFVRAQLLQFRRAVFSAAQQGLERIDGEGCRPSIDVSFPDVDDWNVEDGGSAARDFLRGVIRTETIACFHSSMSPQDALDLYTSPEFRMEAESRIARMWIEGESSCIATKGVPLLLDRTEVCNGVARLEQPDLASEHSQVVGNGTDDGLQLVYFKESLKTFVRTPVGVALHYVNFSRSVNLGRTSRWVAGGKVRESQERQIEALRARIGR